MHYQNVLFSTYSLVSLYLQRVVHDNATSVTAINTLRNRHRINTCACFINFRHEIANPTIGEAKAIFSLSNTQDQVNRQMENITLKSMSFPNLKMQSFIINLILLKNT